MEYKIVQETWLTRFVSNYGDKALQAISTEVYGSGVFKILLLACATLSLISLGWSLHQKQFSKRGLFFLLAFALLYPVHGKPAGYVIVNALGQATAGIFEKAVSHIVAENGDVSKAKNMPPGAVLEMVTSAATSKIKHPETQALVYGVVVNCLPNALTKDGNKASFDDLFNFDSKIKEDRGQMVLTFDEKILDKKALENDNAYAKFKPGKNCYQGLDEMRRALVADLGEQPMNLTERVIGGSREKGQEVTTEEWFKNWQKSGTPFKDLAMNLRLAYAASYEKSKIITEHGWDLNDLSGTWWQGTNTDASLREMLIGLDSFSANSGYDLSDKKNVLANITDSRWAFSLGASIKDLKERIELVPYYTRVV